MDKKKAPKDGPNSYLDWVQEGKVELHVSGFRGELGLVGEITVLVRFTVAFIVSA